MQIIIATLIFALLTWFSTATTATASEFVIEPAVRAGIRYDSNPRRQSDDRDINDARGMIFDVGLPMEYRTPRSFVSLNARYVTSYFSDEENADLEDRDGYLTGAANRSSGRSNIGASYGYTNLSLRTSELEDGGVGGPILTEDKQIRWNIRPYWQYQFTRTNSVMLNAGYEDTRFDEEQISRRFDYIYTDFSVMFRHNINIRQSLALQARLSKFDSENVGLRTSNESTSNSLSLIYEYVWSQKTRLSANIGWARTKSDISRPNAIDPVTGPYCEPALIPFFPCESSSDSTNFVGNVVLSHKLETVSYRIQFGQSITPNSNGAQVLRFNILSTVTKNFSDRFSGSIGISGYTQSNVGTESLDLDQDNLAVNVNLNYKVRPTWSVYANYKYQLYKYPRILLEDFESQNHHVTLGIRYNSTGWRW